MGPWERSLSLCPLDRSGVDGSVSHTEAFLGNVVTGDVGGTVLTCGMSVCMCVCMCVPPSCLMCQTQEAEKGSELACGSLSSGVPGRTGHR